MHATWRELAQLWNERFDRLAIYLNDMQQGSFLNMPNTLTVSTPSDLEIVLTREFDAPRPLVFEALSKAEHLRHWWGPSGSRGEVREVAPPERIVQTFEFEGMPGHISVETMNLEDLGGRTRITVTSRFASVEDRNGMLQSGMEQGAGESYDRLEAYLKTLAVQR